MQQNICLSKFVSQIECFFYIEFVKLNVAHYVNFTLHQQLYTINGQQPTSFFGKLFLSCTEK